MKRFAGFLTPFKASWNRRFKGDLLFLASVTVLLGLGAVMGLVAIACLSHAPHDVGLAFLKLILFFWLVWTVATLATITLTACRDVLLEVLATQPDPVANIRSLLSNKLLLDEPGLTKDQMWLVWGNYPIATGIHKLRMVIVIADSSDEALEAVKHNGYEPVVAISEIGLDEQAKRGLWMWFWMWLCRSHQQRQKLAECRVQRGNGAWADGRIFQNREARWGQFEVERMGQEAYWIAHPDRTPETDTTPMDQWMAEVRERGLQAKEDKDQQDREQTLKFKARFSARKVEASTAPQTDSNGSTS